ncbi:MAG: alkaline phosphatase D family protein [Solirubrobacteraceae bacterium]
MTTFYRDPISRRRLLSGAGVGAGSLLLAAHGLSASKAFAAPRFGDSPFTLGVASGDPAPDGVALWTRLAPEPLTGDGGMPARKVPVQWQVATDEQFRRVARRGTTFATPELGHAVHVDVDGLQPGREYFYRFKAGPELSPIGRTKTAPAFGATPAELAFAFTSCQNYPDGYYTSHQNLAREDLDVVLQLGDYIYEGTAQGTLGRGHLPATEAMSVADYRIRHAQYRSDPNLQAAHAAFPWIVAFDDHEVENNWAGTDSDPDTDPQDFLARRARAFQVYYEHMPLRRPQRPQGPDIQLYRRVAYGDLLAFDVLDTRQYRSDQPPCRDADCAEAFDEQRTILGQTQERWLYAQLAASRSRWNVIAQQVPVYEDADVGLPADKWEGYRASRRRLIEFLGQSRPSNPVVVGGDVHFNSAANLKADFDDPASATVASEFVGTSMSTGGDGTPTTTYDPDPANPHIRFVNKGQRGYVRCTVDAKQCRSDYRVVDTVRSPTSPISTLASFVVQDRSPGVQRA